jgi:hypothetical protein
MSSNTSDAQQQQQQQMPPADYVISREELSVVVCQLALSRAAQKSIESQLSNGAALAQHDSMLHQAGTNALQASDDGLKTFSQSLKVVLDRLRIISTVVKHLLLTTRTPPPPTPGWLATAWPGPWPATSAGPGRWAQPSTDACNSRIWDVARGRRSKTGR